MTALPRKTWMIGLGVSLAVLVLSLVMLTFTLTSVQVQKEPQQATPQKDPFPPLPSKDQLPPLPKLGKSEESNSISFAAIVTAIISGIAALATAAGTISSTMLALRKDQREREVHALEVVKRQGELEGKGPNT